MILSVQGLRFLAAAFVVLTHSMGELAFDFRVGSFGVDLFFVISGFIISHVTEHDRRQFVVKRTIRILPLYWAFTLLLACIAFVAPSLLKQTTFDVYHLIASLFFFPLWTEQTGFQPLLRLGWTLNCEAFFYLLFFISLKICHRHREFLTSAFILTAIFGIRATELSETNPLEFYNRLVFIEFIFGMLIALLYRSQSFSQLQLGFGGALALGVTSLALLIGGSFQDFGLDRAIAFGLPSTTLLYAALCLEPWFRATSPGAKHLLIRGGDLSYPMYLAHIYIIALMGRVLEVDLSLAIFTGTALMITIVVSWGVDVMYDRPIRRVLRCRLTPSWAPTRTS